MDAGLVVNVGEKLDALGVADQIDSGAALKTLDAFIAESN